MDLLFYVVTTFSTEFGARQNTDEVCTTGGIDIVWYEFIKGWKDIVICSECLRGNQEFYKYLSILVLNEFRYMLLR
jgi:hypothetical protein